MISVSLLTHFISFLFNKTVFFSLIWTKRKEYNNNNNNNDNNNNNEFFLKLFEYSEQTLHFLICKIFINQVS